MKTKTKLLIASILFVVGVMSAVFAQIIVSSTTPKTNTEFLILNTTLENGNYFVQVGTYKNETYTIVIDGKYLLDSREYDAEFTKRMKYLQGGLLKIEQANVIKTPSKYDGKVYNVTGVSP